jgi:hypothetical protein
MKYKALENYEYYSYLVKMAGGGFAIGGFITEDFTFAAIGFGAYVLGGSLKALFNNKTKDVLENKINSLEEKVEKLEK